MKVYVAMSGTYDDYGLDRVYVSLEAAQKSYERPGVEWRQLGERHWRNNFDWSDAIEIFEEEVLT